MKNILLILFSASSLFLSGCYGVNVPRTETQTPLAVPIDARPSPFRLSKAVLAIPRGETIASISPRGIGVLCGGSYGMVPRSKITAAFEEKDLKSTFRDTMDAQGYDIADGTNIQFDADDEDARSTYLVGARIVDMKMDLCERRTFWLAHELGYQGESSMTVEWSVYDRLKRVTVMKTTTRGYSRMDLPNYEGIALLLNDSFAGAAHNLGTDRAFYNLIVNGTKPASETERPGPASAIDPAQDVTVPRKALHKAVATPDDIDRIRRTAVVVGNGVGHGSGFFVREDGYILTTADVVGNADQVRIVTHNKTHKLVGDVIRRDRHRNVALVKVNVPDGFAPMVLPIRDEIPQVGETAMTIGAPNESRALQDTVTRGLVSAYRPRDYATRQPVIQVDITTHPGNAGGVLTDDRGNVIGLCEGSYNDEEGRSLTGLKKFIPIGGALEKLGITVDAP